MENGEKLVIGKRCYVGNLAWRTSWQDLKDEFRKCGHVVYANVMRTEDGEAGRLARADLGPCLLDVCRHGRMGLKRAGPRFH